MRRDEEEEGIKMTEEERAKAVGCKPDSFDS